MASDPEPRQGPDYHLDLEIEGGLLLLHVDGSEGPALRQHVDELRRAAERCGLHLVVRGRKDNRGVLA